MTNSTRAGTKQHYVTAAGIQELKRQLDKLKHMRAVMLDEMRDLTMQSSTGSALEDSCRALQQDRTIELDSQIEQIEYNLRTARVVDQPASNSTVQIGSRVTVDVAGVQHVYTIVGSIEADPAQGKVSNESPFGRYLLNKKVNDRLETEHFTRNGLAATIVAIE